MERGLIWLPLLGIFIWLAWAGWNEYQKVEAYQRWAQSFKRAKYDIYAVLGQQEDTLTWGKPTRQGPVDLQSLSLKEVNAIDLLVDGQIVAASSLPERSKTITLQLSFSDSRPSIQIPFTEVELAARWRDCLQQDLS
ncbi:MAG: hypothetical protein SFW36_18815 [Leptolyngbyaceae cyanobacterium bins.59]|nr:hypothetical protein [Leptolyngbyaceae cyanobacterium bins.59]